MLIRSASLPSPPVNKPSASATRPSPGAEPAAWRGMFLLIGLAALPYLTVIDAPFVYDDTTYVVDNFQVTQPGRAFDSLTSSYPPGQERQGLYRPLATLSYALDHALAGLSPRWFHFTNVVLHVLATLAAWALLRRWVPGLATASAALFAVHPVHTEAVSWIVGRAEILCGLLVFLALRFAGTRLVLAAGLLLLALLSKEMAIAAPFLALLPAVFLAAEKRSARATFGVLMAAVLVYLAIRAGVLGGLTPRGGKEFLGDTGLFGRVPAMFVAFGAYLRLSLWPVGLSVDYPWPEVPGFHDPEAWIGLGLFLVLIAVALRTRRRWPWFGLGVAWFVVALVPVSHLFPIGASYAERFLYIPSLGICVILAGAVQQLRASRVRIGVLATLVIAGAVGVLVRNEDWRDEERFYRVAISASPGNATLKNNLGRFHAERNQLDVAVKLFEEAVALDDDHPPALCNLGICRAQQGRVDEAQRLMERCLQLDPSYVPGYINLARVHAMRGRRPAARNALEAALRLSPGNPSATQALRALGGR